MRTDGTYGRNQAEPGATPLNAQAWLVEHRGSWHDISN
jgi:hypothetical protein